MEMSEKKSDDEGRRGRTSSNRMFECVRVSVKERYKIKVNRIYMCVLCVYEMQGN